MEDLALNHSYKEISECVSTIVSTIGESLKKIVYILPGPSATARTLSFLARDELKSIFANGNVSIEVLHNYELLHELLAPVDPTSYFLLAIVHWSQDHRLPTALSFPACDIVEIQYPSTDLNFKMWSVLEACERNVVKLEVCYMTPCVICTRVVSLGSSHYQWILKDSVPLRHIKELMHPSCKDLFPHIVPFEGNVSHGKLVFQSVSDHASGNGGSLVDMPKVAPPACSQQTHALQRLPSDCTHMPMQGKSATYDIKSTTAAMSSTAPLPISGQQIAVWTAPTPTGSLAYLLSILRASSHTPSVFLSISSMISKKLALLARIYRPRSHTCHEPSTAVRDHRGTANSRSGASTNECSSENERGYREHCNLSNDIAEAMIKVYVNAKMIWAGIMECHHLDRIRKIEPTTGTSGITDKGLCDYCNSITQGAATATNWMITVSVAVCKALSEVSEHREVGVVLAIDACTSHPNESKLLVTLARSAVAGGMRELAYDIYALLCSESSADESTLREANHYVRNHPLRNVTMHHQHHRQHEQQQHDDAKPSSACSVSRVDMYSGEQPPNNASLTMRVPDVAASPILDKWKRIYDLQAYMGKVSPVPHASPQGIGLAPLPHPVTAHPSVAATPLAISGGRVTGSMQSRESGSGDCMDNVVEANVKLSDSIVWQLQKEFYDIKGVHAWSNGDTRRTAENVPFYLTSNAYIAKEYARIIYATILDLHCRGQLDTDYPLYIVEVGSGNGRFATLFVAHLNAIISHVTHQGAQTLAGLQVLYIAADVSATSFSHWHDLSPDVSDMLYPNDQQFTKTIKYASSVTTADMRDILKKQHSCSGDREETLLPVLIDFAPFDAEESTDMQCIRSRIILSDMHPSPNPVVTIANYLFDSLSTDAFAVTVTNKAKDESESVSPVTRQADVDNLQPPAISLGALEECLLTLKASPEGTTNGPRTQPDTAELANTAAAEPSDLYDIREATHVPGRMWTCEDVAHFSLSWSRRKVMDIIGRKDDYQSIECCFPHDIDGLPSSKTTYYADTHLNRVLKQTAIRLYGLLSVKAADKHRHILVASDLSGADDCSYKSDSSLMSSCFTLPSGGLRCLARLRNLSAQRVLVSLIADKGFSRDRMHLGMQEPRLSFHGSLSVAVNMRAVCDYINSLPCSYSALTPFTSSSLDICVSVLGLSRDKMPLTFSVFQRGLCTLGVNDVLTIRDHIEDALATHTGGTVTDSGTTSLKADAMISGNLHAAYTDQSQFPLSAVLCLMSKVAYDPDALLQFSSVIARHLHAPDISDNGGEMDGTKVTTPAPDARAEAANQLEHVLSKNIRYILHYLPRMYRSENVLSLLHHGELQRPENYM